MAYLLGLNTVPFSTGRGRTARNARDFFQNVATWSHEGPGGPNVLWNGLDGSGKGLEGVQFGGAVNGSGSVSEQ